MSDESPSLLDLNTNHDPTRKARREPRRARLVGLLAAVIVLVLSAGLLTAMGFWSQQQTIVPSELPAPEKTPETADHQGQTEPAATVTPTQPVTPTSSEKKSGQPVKQSTAVSSTPPTSQITEPGIQADETSLNANANQQASPSSNSPTTESTSPAPTTMYRGAHCTIDATNAPELAQFAQTIGGICDREYPALIERLAGTRQAVTIVFKPGQANVGETLGTTVSLQPDWFVRYPNDTGAVVHELVHVVQAYPAGSTFWLTEGIADYYRYELGYANSWSYAHCGSGSERYANGYWCAAAFLNYLTKTYGGTVLSSLNTALRNGTYSESHFSSTTGKELSQLWADCLGADCNGGTP